MPSSRPARPAPIAALSCDVGFTLLETCRHPLELYLEAAERVGVTVEPPVMLALMRTAHRMRTRGKFHDNGDSTCDEASERAQWRQHSAFIAASIPPLQERLEAWYQELMRIFDDPLNWRPIAGARKALEAFLQGGARVIFVTNWHEAVAPILAHHGLDRLPVCTLISARVGCRKPNPAIFAEAIRLLGIAPERILHIGDSPEEDVAGALASGMRAALYCPPRSAAPPPPAPAPGVALLAGWEGLEELLAAM